MRPSTDSIMLSCYTVSYYIFFSVQNYNKQNRLSVYKLKFIKFLILFILNVLINLQEHLPPRYFSTSLVTMAPAPTTALSPHVHPGRISRSSTNPRSCLYHNPCIQVSFCLQIMIICSDNHMRTQSLFQSPMLIPPIAIQVRLWLTKTLFPIFIWLGNQYERSRDEWCLIEILKNSSSNGLRLFVVGIVLLILKFSRFDICIYAMAGIYSSSIIFTGAPERSFSKYC